MRQSVYWRNRESYAREDRETNDKDGVLAHKPPQFQNTPTRHGIYPCETKLSLVIDRDPHCMVHNCVPVRVTINN